MLLGSGWCGRVVRLENVYRLNRLQGGAKGEAVEEYGLVTDSREIPVTLRLLGGCLTSCWNLS